MLVSQDVTSGTEEQAHWAAEPRDVMCCVKAFMRDTALQQPPIQCLKPAQLQQLASAAPNSHLSPRPPEADLSKNISVWAAFAAQLGYHTAAAALQRIFEDRNMAKE
jgi:hypothetical protein